MILILLLILIAFRIFQVLASWGGRVLGYVAVVREPGVGVQLLKGPRKGTVRQGAGPEESIISVDSG